MKKIIVDISFQFEYDYDQFDFDGDEIDEMVIEQKVLYDLSEIVEDGGSLSLNMEITEMEEDEDES